MICISLIVLVFGCVENSQNNPQNATNNNPTGQFNLGVEEVVSNNSNALNTTNNTNTISAKKGDNVEVHYTGRLKDGTIFDSSLEREPLAFEVGAGQMIKGFDAAVLGMKVGEKKTVEIQPSEAYGEKQNELIITVDSNSFADFSAIKVGSEVTASSGMTGKVTSIEGNKAVIDFNHFLAGKVLVFEIELVSIN